MNKLVVAVALVISLSGCAGVRADIANDEKLCWTGDVIEADALKKDNWLSFNVVPSVWGGVGFAINGESVSANLFPVNAGADFVEKTAEAPLPAPK